MSKDDERFADCTTFHDYLLKGIETANPTLGAQKAQLDTSPGAPASGADVPGTSAVAAGTQKNSQSDPDTARRSHGEGDILAELHRRDLEADEKMRRLGLHPEQKLAQRGDEG
jgi:hypothetical protein